MFRGDLFRHLLSSRVLFVKSASEVNLHSSFRKSFAGLLQASSSIKTDSVLNKGHSQTCGSRTSTGLLYLSTETSWRGNQYEGKKQNRNRGKNRTINGGKFLGTLGGFGVLYGAVLVTKEDPDSNPDSSQIMAVFPEFDKKKDVRIARKIVNPLDTSGLKLRLYQYQSCPFCCKVRAALDYYGFSYEVVEVNPVFRKELKFSEYKKVPLLVVQGHNNKELHDSSFIVSLLRTFTLDPKRNFQEIVDFYPHHMIENEKGKDQIVCVNKYFVMFQEQIKTKEGIANKREEREWREWVDNTFVHVISPNVYRTLSEAKETFNWFSKFSDYNSLFSAPMRIVVVNIGALAMWHIGNRLRKRHQLKPDVRESLYDAAREWKQGLGHRKFMGGNQPNLADLALYGAMTSFEGCRAFQEMLDNVDIGLWFNSVKSFVENHHGAQEFIENLA